MFRLSVNKQVASKAVSHVGQAARAAYTSAHGIENETWVDADVDTVDGDASFSAALTVDELSASREHLERSFAPASSDDASSTASTEDSVDADGQMMTMQSNALFHTHAQQRAVFDAACAMAIDSHMQAAALEAMRSNPDVFASMQHLAAQHGMTLEVDPSATERRLGTAYVGQNGPPRPAVQIEEIDPDDEQASRNPFAVLGDMINDALDGAGDAIAAYVGRMRRRIARLSAQLQGLPPPHFVGAGDPTAEPSKGSAAEDAGAQQQHEPEGNLLKDIVVTVASLIITVAFVGRIGRLGRMRF